MYSLYWTWFTPDSSDGGHMPLEATTLEAAQREALALAKPWGALRKDTLFNLSIYAGAKRLSYWNTLAPVWERS